MEIKILQAQEKDLLDILEVENEVFGLETNKSLSHALQVESFKYFIAKCEETCVGFIAISCLNDEGEILSLAVKSKFRKLGIGEKLTSFALNYLKSHGAKNVFLEVAVSNVVAQKLYSKLGFQEIYRRKDYYRHKNLPSEDAIIMSVSL